MELTREQIRLLILHGYKLSLKPNAAATARRINEAWSEGTVGERMVGCLNVELTIFLVGLKEVCLQMPVPWSYYHLCGGLTSRNCSLIGSSADVIVGHFAINYHDQAQALGIDLEDLYSAMLADGDINPVEWDVQGRQANLYKYTHSLHTSIVWSLRW